MLLIIITVLTITTFYLPSKNKWLTIMTLGKETGGLSRIWRLENRKGIGVFSFKPKTELSLPLNFTSSISENLRMKYRSKHIHILLDSQAALKVLSEHRGIFKTSLALSPKLRNSDVKESDYQRFLATKGYKEVRMQIDWRRKDFKQL